MIGWVNCVDCGFVLLPFQYCTRTKQQIIGKYTTLTGCNLGKVRVPPIQRTGDKDE